MSEKIAMANGVYDLSHINNAKQLHEEIALLRVSLKKEEQALAEHFKKMPQEAVKAAADAFLPSFINNMIANKSWKILTSSAGLLMNPFSKKFRFGKQVLGGAKRLGMLALVKTAYNMWRTKTKNEASKAVSLKTDKRITQPKPFKQ